MNKKGAVGLPMNVLVVVIISFVILAGGISLLYQFIGGAEDIKKNLDAQTEAELNKLLTDQGKKVALPRNTAKVEPGKSKIFGLGILNIDENEYKDQFSFTIQLSKAINPSEKVFTPTSDTTSWFLFSGGPFTIKENNYHKEPILVKVPSNTQKGTYIFNVKVKAGSQTYGSIKKINVLVK